MSVCGQGQEEPGGEDGGRNDAKAVSKLVRVLTVLAYLVSVSLAAILLSVYYVCVWRSPDLPREMEAAARRDTHHHFFMHGGSNNTVNDEAPASPDLNNSGESSSQQTTDTTESTQNSTFQEVYSPTIVDNYNQSDYSTSTYNDTNVT